MRAATRHHRPAVTAVVLAAGGSSRLGTPKQLVRRRGRTLIEQAIDAAQHATGRPVIVVIGAEKTRLHALLARRYGTCAVEVVHHAGWRSGLAGSLRRGLHAVPSDAEGVLLMLSDQPFVERGSLGRLLAAWRQRPSHAAAARYAARLGVPAIVPRRRLSALRGITGDEGARRVLADDARVTAVDLPEAAFDVDTPADLRALTRDRAALGVRRFSRPAPARGGSARALRS